MRNLLRVLAFDVAAPLAAVAALLTIGVMLGWPLWGVGVLDPVPADRAGRGRQCRSVPP